MKTLLMIDESSGFARAWLARMLLNQAAAETQTEIVDTLKAAQLVILLGNVTAPDTESLRDKRVYRGKTDEALHQPARFLHQAQHQSLPASELAAAHFALAPAKRLVAITACPTGVAHTFMSAEAIEQEAKRRGWWVKAETRGSAGAGNTLSDEDISQADLVLVAADIDVDLSKFSGKLLYRTTTGRALKKTAETLDNALKQARTYQPAEQTSSQGKSGAGEIYRHLLTGVSYMLPMVVAGGLCIAISFMFGIYAFEEKGSFPAALMQIGGQTAFALMVPVLAGYIAFSVADRPGLVPGLIGGMLAVTAGAGFIGGIIAGFLAGYLVKTINQWLQLPAGMESLKPILIIPLVSAIITGLAMIYLIGPPVAKILAGLTRWLQNMGTGNAALLGAILGGMMCSDMGGPVNKAAYAFAVGLISSEVYTPMAAVMAAGMVPPLALGLATLLARGKFDKEQRQSGKVALVLGACFITEGAIPFAARDPVRVLPCCIAGGVLTGAISMVTGSKLMAPHGGLLVVPTISSPLGYLMAILAGALLAGLTYALIKPGNASADKQITG